MEISAIVIHHTGASRTQTFEDIRRYHMKPVAEGGRGWSDIGYHILITEDGRAHKGRDWKTTPACVGGQNTGKFCIAATGDNKRDGMGWNEHQKVALRAAIDMAVAIFGAPVHGHEDFSDTECPGLDINTFWQPC